MCRVGLANPAARTIASALAAEPFPALQAGKLVLRASEHVRLVDERTLGKYRIQPEGSVKVDMFFLVTLFGETCSKVEMVNRRKLGWHDYLVAINHAIEREIGLLANCREPLPRGVQRAVDVTVRDTDFTILRSGK